MGVAWLSEETVHVTEIPLEEDFQLLGQLIAVNKPRFILACKGTDAALLAALAKPVEQGESPTDVQVLKKTEFADETARQRLLSVVVEGVPAELHAAADRELWVASIIDLAKLQMVRAAGALVGHAAVQELLTTATPLRLVEISAAGLVRMDGDAFQSLQIFGTEFHPSAAGVGGAKEGFSLFARMNRARSVTGRRLLRQWFLRPINDTRILNDRLDHVEKLRDPRHAGAVKQIHALMSSVKDARRICAKIASLQATSSDWIGLRSTLAAILDLRDLTRPMSAESGLRVLMALQANAGLQQLGKLLQLMDAVLDLDQSRSSKRLTVRAGVDPTLDELKHTYQGLGDLLTKVASAQINALPAHVQIDSLSTCYLPQIGYAVVVPRQPRVPIAAQIAAVQGHLQYQFDTEAYIYFKSSITKGLDEELGDIHSRIVDRENLCIRELQVHVLDMAETMRHFQDMLAELDCMLSLALSATELRMERPRLTDDAGVLHITAGRHPLQELSVQTFVPNDTAISPGHTTQLITGPNASGKSVYIKQVALVAYLAHIGSFVPAESAVISMLDGIYARIQTRESAGVGKSSFLLDLTQVSTMLRHATPRSLCLLDEFGKGTDPADGAGLLGATLEQLVATRAICLATTHFAELLTPGVLRNSSDMTRLAMSFLVRPDLNSEDGIVLLFKLRPDDDEGTVRSSFGAFCARTAGIPAAVVARAAQVQTHMARGTTIGRLESADHQRRDGLYRAIYDALAKWNPDRDDPQDLIRSVIVEP